MRANPRTTPVKTNNPAKRNHPTGHHASQSSHSDRPAPPNQPNHPAKPPSCEPILTQRPPGTAKPTKPPRQTAIVRANPHTMPVKTNNPADPDHPNRHRASQSSHNAASARSRCATACQHPDHLRFSYRQFGYRRTALDFHARCGMLGTTQNPTPQQSESRDSRPGKRENREDRKSGK